MPKALSEFATGARVKKPAGAHDPRTGTVCRQMFADGEFIGVHWDLTYYYDRETNVMSTRPGTRVVVFPPETPFEDAA